MMASSIDNDVVTNTWLSNNLIHILITVLGFIILAIPTVIGTSIYIDSRYVHADTIKDITKAQTDAISKLRAQIIEDKVFELDLKKSTGVSTNIDDAMLDKYRREQLVMSKGTQ